ncbi:MAG: hypothetical protein JRN29_02345, partial [Nitrososphaerota archaeon]|nr:hypothetical protein [Nitrososphaerota archaeon]
MVLAGKLFKAESSGLDQLFQKLEGFRVEKEDAETKMLLATEVKDLKADERSVSGRMLKDEVIRIRQKEEFKPILRTVGAPFSFRRLHDQTFLFVQEKKRRANELANDLSRILFMRPGAIVEARVKP